MRRCGSVGVLLSCSAVLSAFPAMSSAAFSVTNLVSDGFVPAAHIDPDLVNPWGISFSPTSPFWVADNGTGFATIYNGAGMKQSLVVTIPPPGGSPAGATAAPTGNIFNNTSSFQVGTNQPAAFIFATEDGTISGWNPTANATHAILKVDNSASGAVYKGLALGSNSSGNFLYATDFHTGKIDVFDTNFAPATLAGTFTDPNLPSPAIGHPGFAPFGIQNIGSKLFVTYALQDAAQHDDVAALGNGFVDVFDTNGNFLQRLVSGGQLDSPWGLRVAPAGFGQFGNDLLVGNFGNSHVNAYSPTSGAFVGALTDTGGTPLSLTNAPDAKGLWGITFGNGGNAGSPNTLFFTSGINDEADGLFGSVQPTTTAIPLPNAAYMTLVSLAGLLGVNWLRRRRAVRM